VQLKRGARLGKPARHPSADFFEARDAPQIPGPQQRLGHAPLHRQCACQRQGQSAGDDVEVVARSAEFDRHHAHVGGVQHQQFKWQSESLKQHQGGDAAASGCRLAHGAQTKPKQARLRCDSQHLQRRWPQVTARQEAAGGQASGEGGEGQHQQQPAAPGTTIATMLCMP
jgi:hypothetical protein